MISTRRRRKLTRSLILAAAIIVAAVCVTLAIIAPWKKGDGATEASLPAATSTASPATTPADTLAPDETASWETLAPTPSTPPVSTPTPTPATTEGAALPATETLPAIRTLYEAAVDLYPELEQPIMSAAVRITYVNNEIDTLYEVKLHLFPADVAPGAVTISTVSLNGTEIYYSLTGANESIMSIPLSREITPGESCDIYIRYSFVIPSTGNRLGMNTTGAMLGNALPIANVYENGAWREDEYTSAGDAFYSDAADYKVSIRLNSRYDLAYTGELIEESEKDGFTTRLIAATNVRDFAFAALDMKKLHAYTVEAEYTGATVHAYAATSTGAKRGGDIAAAALDSLGRRIGLYPYRELFVVPFDMGGGMEYPGLIMVNGGSFTATYPAQCTMITAHETAHQWFYAVVGSDQITSPWVDESLVEYLGIEFVREYLGESVFESTARDRYKGAEAHFYDKPLSGDLYSFDDYEYFAVVYAYGYDLYKELVALIGEKTFYAALSTYYNARAYRIATGDDLISAFSDAADEDLSPWFTERLNKLPGTGRTQ